MQKDRAPRNRTLSLDDNERAFMRDRLVSSKNFQEDQIDRTILGSALEVLPRIKKNSIHLMIADPPYNLTKSYNGSKFDERDSTQYEAWLESWLSLVPPVLTDDASIYICSEWRSSNSVQRILEKYFKIQNRITWEREKGRGALRNWKNCHEDIWFCTVSDNYYFNVDAVKQRRRVIAPYKDQNGAPKDWNQEKEGNFRVTHPSNLWSDISVPFWSMPENTDHPTQKPEKLIAKLILASSKPGDIILDTFLGSGTTSVVAAKLGRHYLGVEVEEEYCLLAEKRLLTARLGDEIQGYSGGLFWDRNSLADQQKEERGSVSLVEITQSQQTNLF